MKLDAFTTGYIACALWSSMDNANEQGGDPLDRNYSETDLAPETLERIKSDCAKFQADNAELLAQYTQRINRVTEDPPEAYAGHDFWLTRNGHGAGFWDRNLGELGDKLTEASKAFGECDLYVGDDKRLHI
jgi:hypothetical protein